ncbi:DUF7024 domain-containing protein [Massilia sp. DD77]|uniref:DUF7024 domain-containing protein n=1 Tax=Massilia sp. DD77 TaxID=3109349 RepID=UPI002FFF11A3
MARRPLAAMMRTQPTPAVPASASLPRAAGDRLAWLCLAAGLAAVFAWLLHRHLGLNPVIFADEWYYSKMARLQPLAEAIVPSYLYLWLFSASTSCGSGFLDCVRIGNALLFVGAGPFVYLIGRRVARPAAAVAVTLLSLLAPFNLYTALFMPEAMYYFGFIVLSWMALNHTRWSAARLGLASGAVLGVMSLVKVHALFLLPALCLYLACAAWLREPRGAWLTDGFISAVLAAVATVLAKFGVGYVLAGEPGLSLFGSFYATAAHSGAGRSLLSLAPPAFVNGRGHLMVLAVLLPLPMAMLALALVSGAARRQADAALNRLTLYSFLMLGSAAGVTVMYTASIAGLGPLEVVRLHLRYYSFVFPLLLLIAAAPLGRHQERRQHPRLAWLVAALVGAAVLAALVLLPRYSPTPIDGPEIAALNLQSWQGWTLAAVNLAVLLLWAAGSRFAAPLFLFAAVPFTLAIGAFENDRYLSQVRRDWPPDAAGKLAYRTIPKAEHGQVTVAGSAMMDIMRAQFHIDHQDTGMLELPKDAPIDAYQLPARHKWLLVIGRHALPEGAATPAAVTGDYALWRLAGDFRSLGAFHLSRPYGGLVRGADGLSVAEPWGRWSTGKQVVLHFDRPLPKVADVLLKAQAFADNTTLPFTLRIGGESAQFRLGPSLQEVKLRLYTDGAQRSLAIEVPRPTTPRSLGQWADDRALGIGIAEVSIGDGG